jgi:TDG/mug DNA glycosylase family protein
VGNASVKAEYNYSGIGNKFWSTLYDVGLTPRLVLPPEYARVTPYGIGLTDLMKSTSGVDTAIRFAISDADALRHRIEEYGPRILCCFNGKRVAQEFFGVRKVDYGLQGRAIGVARIFIAPSTSAAGNRWWDASWWDQLANLARSSTDCACT